jgi:hypothetical protein
VTNKTQITKQKGGCVSDFSISFQSRTDLDLEEMSFVHSVTGEILCSPTDEDEDEVVVGELALSYINMADAMENGYDPYLFLDVDGSLAELTPLYNSDGEFSKRVQRIVKKEVFSLNTLVIDRLEILPNYRGQKLGLQCIHRCMQLFAHDQALVTLRCVPLQFRRSESARRDEWITQLRLDKFDAQRDVCQAKLEKYFQQLGFKKVPKTNLMVLNPALRQPGPEELGFNW